MTNNSIQSMGMGEGISPSESLPMHVARQWGFPLQWHEHEGMVFYNIKDWIAGLTDAKGLKPNHIWWNYKARQGGLSTRVLPYQGPQNMTYDMDYTDDEGLYKLATARYRPVKYASHASISSRRLSNRSERK